MTQPEAWPPRYPSARHEDRVDPRARGGGSKGGSTTSWTLSVDRFLRALVGR